MTPEQIAGQLPEWAIAIGVFGVAVGVTMTVSRLRRTYHTVRALLEKQDADR